MVLSTEKIFVDGVKLIQISLSTHDKIDGEPVYLNTRVEAVGQVNNVVQSYTVCQLCYK